MRNTVAPAWGLLLLTPFVFAQPAAGPARTFAAQCSICHGGDGNGSDRAPAILPFIRSHSDAEVSALVHSGRPDRGMPSFNWSDAELQALTANLRTMAGGAPAGGAPGRGAGAAGAALGGAPGRGGRGGAGGAGGGRGGRGGFGGFQPQAATLKMQDGSSLSGTLTSSGHFSATMTTADGKIHLLARNGDIYTEKPIEPKLDWLNYDGGYNGDRYVPLDQINASTIKHLAPAWIFPVPNAPRVEATPVVMDGVMYITTTNDAFALDATTGRQMWHFTTPRTPGLLSEAGGGANRGAAISADKIFMVTDNAHLLALDRLTGKKVWDVTMGEVKDGYTATGAPMVIGDLVISGVAGGEEGARGLIDAYRTSNGERIWRYYTVPLPGEKGSETWIGNALEHGCGATWLTGSYDPSLQQLYWTVGNPCPDFNGDERKGDNLWTNAVVALDVKTGTLKWYFQFTPHDTHDWDANEPLILLDENWEGRPRKLMVHADVNGFFFVLDRTNGKMLLATPMGKQDWNEGYDKDGHPHFTSTFETTLEGTMTCATGAAKWASQTLDPTTNRLVVRLSEGCSAVRKDPRVPQMGERFYGGSFGQRAPGGESYLHAIDIQTGKTAWEYPLVGGGFGGTGMLGTAGHLVFFGEAGGTFTALDEKTGAPVWHFETGQNWRASPMSYMVGGKQYIALAGQDGIFSFALAQ